MKQKVIKVAVATALVGVGVWAGVNFASPLEAESNTLTPGSIEDPVVTKSYVDEQLAKLSGGSAGGNTGSIGGTGTVIETNSKLEVVAVPAGKTMYANQGTQVVVRVGKAIVYSDSASGVSDLTDGTERTKGMSVPTNHLLLFPRDGRGILPDPTQKNGLTVLVIGGYTLK